MNARTFVKCATVWIAICLALRPARSTFVPSNYPGGAAILHSREYVLSCQHIDTPAPSLDMRREETGIEGWGTTENERLQATPTRYYPVKRALPLKQDGRTFSFDKV